MSTKKRNTEKSAAARTRKDAIISMTMPYTTRCLMDMLSDFRGLTRSEYVRYLILRDAEEFQGVERIMAEAVAEGIKTLNGRPATSTAAISPFAAAEEIAYGEMINKYAIFEGRDTWLGLFEYDEDSNRFFVTPKEKYTFEEFLDLDFDTMAKLIQTKLKNK